jgi:tRNA threonylcarbamoyl adenosine modification protein YeaZ
MTYILHLETATRSCSVALSCNGKLVAVKEILTEQFSHAENLTLFVQDVLDQANIVLTNVAAVSVSSGPGSYTGLRIGVSTAKGFCYALGIPLIAIDSLYSLAVQAAEKHPGKKLCPVKMHEEWKFTMRFILLRWNFLKASRQISLIQFPIMNRNRSCVLVTGNRSYKRSG